ncbi:MAG: DUF4388 domain-containing protein, partial [Actinomycetota bacterium]
MLKGTLDDFSLPDVLRLTSHARKTGRLDVERRSGSGRVYFRDGDVYYAETSKSKEPLGQKLMRMRAITEPQLQRALEEHEATGRRLGDILTSTELVTEEQVVNSVRSQIEDALFDLLRWDLGAFRWEPDVAIDPEVELSVSVENLIMEASRRLEELALIKKAIPSAEIVFAMAPKPPDGAVEINITSDEWQVLVLVDEHRSVADIATLVGHDAFQTTRTLYGLLSSGLIVRREAREEQEELAQAVGESNVLEFAPMEQPPKQSAPPPAPPQPPPPAPAPENKPPRVDRAAAARARTRAAREQR